MSRIKALDGNAAIAQGVMLSKVQLIAAYPITPQTPIVESLSNFIDKGIYNATYINVESEHSALSAVIGASTTGVRTFTASASHGLALMHEMTGVASGSRLPIVMGVVNRSLPAPNSLWCDHSDIMTERDQGWIQLFAKNPQEALDFVMIAYKTSEDERILLPTMVAIDGFYLSHLTEPVNIPSEEDANKYIQDFIPNNFTLDPSIPYAVNNLASPEIFTEIKYNQKLAMDKSEEVLHENFKKFDEIFNRKYSTIESYMIEDAEIILVCLGSMAGTAKHVVDIMRESGEKVGLLRIVSFRPFPKKVVAKLLNGKNNVAVIDRISSPGSFGPLYEEILASVNINVRQPNCYSFIAGLGGRDIWEKTIADVFNKTKELSNNKIRCSDSIWIDLKKGE